MYVGTARVVEARPLGPARVLLWLSAPELSRAARPGQFIMLRAAPGLDPFLARPYWLHRIRDTDDGEEFALLIQISGVTSSRLARTLPGAELPVVGPLGRPLTLHPGVRGLALLGEGIQLAPLVWLADEECARGRAVTLVHAASTAAELYPVELIPPEIEYQTCTADGSRGNEGDLLDEVEPLLAWADQLVISAPEPTTLALGSFLRRAVWRRPATAFVTPPMPCATGACGICAIDTRRHGRRLACLDGPAFDLRALV